MHERHKFCYGQTGKGVVMYETFSMLGLAFMVLFLPAVPIILLWYFIAPAVLWQIVLLIILSIIIYVGLIILEIIVLINCWADSVSEKMG